MSPYDKRLLSRTCQIIELGGVILLKCGDWYLGQHTNIAAGYDSAVLGRRDAALQFDTLELAFLLAPYFDSKVVVFYPRGKRK